MTRKLTNPCYDGKTHAWRTLINPVTKQGYKWCCKCGKEKNNLHGTPKKARKTRITGNSKTTQERIAR